MYSRNRQVFSTYLAGTRSNNAVLFSLSIEADRSYSIHSFYIFQIVVGTASTAIDLELDGVVVATCAYSNTGAGSLKMSATTLPILVSGATGGSRLQLTQNVAEVAATARQIVHLDMESPFRTAV